MFSIDYPFEPTADPGTPANTALGRGQPLSRPRCT